MYCSLLYVMGKKKKEGCEWLFVIDQRMGGGVCCFPFKKGAIEYESRVCVPFVTASLYVCLCFDCPAFASSPFPPLPPSPSPSSLPVPHCTLISCTHPPLPLPPILALVLRRRRLFACSRMAFMPLIFIHVVVVVVLPLCARIDCSCSFSCRSLRLSAVSTPCFFFLFLFVRLPFSLSLFCAISCWLQFPPFVVVGSPSAWKRSSRHILSLSFAFWVIWVVAPAKTDTTDNRMTTRQRQETTRHASVTLDTCTCTCWRVRNYSPRSTRRIKKKDGVRKVIHTPLSPLSDRESVIRGEGDPKEKGEWEGEGVRWSKGKR